MSQKVITQGYQLPADPVDRSKFLDGIKRLAEECKATWVAGSLHDEMAYADLLASELEQEVGDLKVGDLRQQFEKGFAAAP
ncbi:hypothetical protein ACRS3X_08235 [Ectopseudomonas hydrolytica]|uniref:hypothetical protein n=1 Tax=Ectopseudomonas hydrolytica TaxID=2493633 RepID=UPI003EE03511